MPALPPPMLRYLYLPILAIGTAACGSNHTAIAGTLADSTAATEVSIGSTGLTAPIEAGAFRLDAVEGDTVELRFHDGDDEVGRMVVAGVRGSGELSLQRVWFEDGEALPASVDRGSDDPVLVNGLRMSAAASLPRSIDVRGVVLAVSDIGDAMIVRPDQDDLPDLKVLVAPAAAVRGPDGEDFDADDVESGDSVRVNGSSIGDYIMVGEMLVLRSSNADVGDAPEAGSAIDLDDSPDNRPALQARDDAVSDGERDDNDDGEERAKGNSGGRGKGEGRGRGRD